MRSRALVSALVLCAATLACKTDDPGSGDPDASGPPADANPQTLVSDPLHDLPTGIDQWTSLCARGYGDLISQKICAGTAPPTLTSLADLRALLGLTIDPNATGAQPNVRMTFLGHSTALPQRHVSAINPRLFVFTIPNTDGSANQRYQVMAFARGEAFVELVANDPTAGNTLRFFLLRFHPLCESTGGCNNADLYTPTIESGWTGWSIYDDGDLKNTTVDCRQCHQPGGPSTNKMMRMQELDGPWLHWFYEEIPENAAMIDNVYLQARPTEQYGGVPPAMVHPTRPIALQRLLINNGFANQPNKFDSMTIRAEMAGGSSPTWNAIYANAVNGSQIMVPYYGVPQTDPAKIATAVQAYRDVATGALPRDQLPDLADVFLDSAEPSMSHAPAPGLDGRGILVHMCQHCHNSRLDQTISRARFNVEQLDQLAPSIKQEAIRRLQLDAADIYRMPPKRFHSLSQAEIDLAITALSQ
jgi:hypothetical protein